MNMKLSGENIHLRALEPEDLEVLYQWENDEDLWNLSNTHAPFSKYMLRKYLESASNDIFELKEIRFIIETTDNKNPVGTLDLFDFDPYNLRAGVGILIYEKENRKKGYASEALDICINYSFATLALKQIYCNISEDNEESLKLFIKKGFVITGRKIDWLKSDNGWLTEFLLQLVNRSR